MTSICKRTLRFICASAGGLPFGVFGFGVVL